MTDQHDIGSGRVQLTPEAVGQLLVAVAPGAEPGVVPIGERALVVVRREIGLEPTALRAFEVATADRPTVRVQRDEMPVTDVVAVVAAVVRTGLASEVLEVPPRTGAVVLVVARRGMELGAEPTPRGCEGALEVAQGAVLVLVVAQEQDPRELGVEHQVRRRPLIAGPRNPGAAVVVVVRGSAGDVTGSRDHRGIAISGRPHPHEGDRRHGDDHDARPDDEHSPRRPAR